MDWIKHELLTGFQKLLTLGLERQPAGEVIPGTVATWFESITHRRVFHEERDRPRFRAAFIDLAGRMKHWPTPQDFLESMPSFQEPRELPRLESEESKARARKAMDELGEMLRVKEPRQNKPPQIRQTDDFPRCCEKGTKEQPVCDECRAEALADHGPVTQFWKEAST
ncbi:hypothetical protein FHW84_002507 [Dyella sp. SG562]|uniref:hypothetical protein n=1 Tax=Dyella sp. SG562 TaxID=2587017 RepID=UPI00141EB6CA|nr:hypothetical protein [Dyella sp. SG562]NII73934.1 hypothetical protein [Dyella sp. SG562]